MKRQYTHWTIEALMEVAKKYETRGVFCDEEPSAYMACKRRNIFEKACAHMKPARKKGNKITFEMVEKVAKKYQTRGDFAKKARPEYSAASRRGILDEVCKHMPRYSGKGETRGPNSAGKKKIADKATSLNAMMGL